MGKFLNLHLRDDRYISFSEPAVVGVINLSSNSFYNPHHHLDSALRTAEKMLNEGVDILDIGAEATNPYVNINQDTSSLKEECDLLLPAICAIKKEFNVLVSIDTSRALVMRETVFAGADMINDQRALRMKDALMTVAELRTPVCLMHFPDENRKPGAESCSDFLNIVKNDLQNIVEQCKKAGILSDRIIIDPGFGQGHFRKNLEENFYLLNHLSELVSLGLPVLSAWSRKSMVGDIINQLPADRLFGSIAADALAVYNGASLIRTHDVKASREAIKIAMYAKNNRG